jgi:hypothetical protein
VTIWFDRLSPFSCFVFLPADCFPFTFSHKDRLGGIFTFTDIYVYIPNLIRASLPTLFFQGIVKLVLKGKKKKDKEKEREDLESGLCHASFVAKTRRRTNTI